MLPGAEYAVARGMQMIARLPHTYRNSKGWFGVPPTELLARIARPAICVALPSSTVTPNHDDPSLMDSSLNVHLLGDEDPESAEATAPTAEAAQQQAALSMGHVLEKRLSAALQEGTAIMPGQNLKRRKVEPGTEPLNVRVLERGDGGVAVPGVLINFDYRVTFEGGEHSGRLLEAGNGRLEYGSGCVVSAVENLIDTAGVGGKASCTVSLPLGGPNELSQQDVVCSLEVKSDQKVHYVGTAQSNASLFNPPMVIQRCAKMAALLEQHHAHTVVDVGCGDGKLIEYLMQQARDGKLGLRKVVGIDLDGLAVRRGQKRMLQRNPDLLNGPSSAELQLFQGDIACKATTTTDAWGDLAGMDAAVFQEVVEHLDPEPLRYLGPSLLAGLRPRLLLLSTPNFDYNAVLHHLNSQLLPNKFRNSDHRFEWTRAEFQDWCGRLAHEHGYEVSYDGLGKAISEASVLEDPKAEVYGKDVGHATQVAIFQRQGTSLPSAEAHKFVPIFQSGDNGLKE